MSTSNLTPIQEKVNLLLQNVKSQILAKKPLVIPIFTAGDFSMRSANKDDTQRNTNIYNQASKIKYITFPSATTLNSTSDQPRKRKRMLHSMTSSHSIHDQMSHQDSQSLLIHDQNHHHQRESRSSNTSRTFAIYLFLLSQIKQLLDSHTVTTKRDLYYKNVALFGNQSTVDKAIDTIAASLNVHRRLLNVVASPKSCVFGNLSILGMDGTSRELRGVYQDKFTFIKAKNCCDVSVV